MLATWITMLALAADAPAKGPFDYPLYLAAGADGTLFISDQNVPALFKLDAKGALTTLHKGSKEYRTPLYRPRGMAVAANGDLYVADPATMDVYRVTPKGVAEPLTGEKITLLNGKQTTMGKLVQPEGVAVGKDGVVYVGDLRFRAIFKIKQRDVEKLADVPAPRGMALDRDGASLVVLSHGEAQLLRVRLADGMVTPVIQGRPFQFPLSVAVRPNGDYLVTDNYSRCLWLATPAGKVEKYVGGDPLRNPTGLAIFADGRTAVADPHAKIIHWLSEDKKWTPAAIAE